jgi:SAM-dependent methyltransferase
VAGRHELNHLSDNFDDSYFFGGGAGYPDYVADGRILRARGHRYSRILARYRQPGRVLDVGSAAGFILQGLIDCGWSGRGLEPNQTMVEFARARLGLDVDCGNLEDYAGQETFDLITMFQSIMHFYDVRRACGVAANLTRPGGHWLIEAFNPYSWTGRLLGRHWHDYNPPSVLHWFSPQALARLAQQYGLQPVAMGRAPKSISAAHAKSVLALKLGGSVCGRAIRVAAELVPDRLQIAYPGDDIFWALFTKPESLRATGRATTRRIGIGLSRKRVPPQAAPVTAEVPAPPDKKLRLLPRNLLVRTGPVDMAEWNSRFLLGPISRQRFRMALSLLPCEQADRLLEIGYGSGIFMPALHERTRSLFGIDVHHRHTDVERSLSRAGVQAKLLTGDIAGMPFPDRFFDAVIGISCLEFIEDLDQALREILRVIGPRGHLVVITPKKSKLIDAGFRLLTGKDPEDDFQGRRQRVTPTLLRYFEIQRQCYWPPRPALPLYAGYCLRPKQAAPNVS